MQRITLSSSLIRTYAAYAVSLERLAALQSERLRAEKKRARRELAVLRSRKDQLEKDLQDLYEGLVDGSLDRDLYLSHKQRLTSQIQELGTRIAELEELSRRPADGGSAFIGKYREYAELETLTGDVAKDLVNRVTVHFNDQIEIELALRDELEALLREMGAASCAS